MEPASATCIKDKGEWAPGLTLIVLYLCTKQPSKGFGMTFNWGYMRTGMFIAMQINVNVLDADLSAAAVTRPHRRCLFQHRH